jgi:GntR family transcriptional regulator / MocR family aminotransferase
MPAPLIASMFLKLDQKGLLYSQVYRALRSQILSGRMHPGSRVPSTRWLGSELGISRNTALLAYDQLIAEGYLAAGSHAGTFVASELPKDLTFVAPDHVSRKHAIPSAVRLSSFASRVSDDPVNATLIREILLRPALPYDFRYGRPSFADFPHATWDRMLARCARRRSIRDLDYGAPKGVASLREELADYLHRARAVNCSPEQILIVSGSQQAIDLPVRVLIDRDDRVVLENPHYFPARNVSRAAGAVIEVVDVDDQGMKLSELAAKKGRVRLVFVTPSHQFPTGALMPLGRRLELLAWANRTGAVIFEDDYDSEYRYSGRPVEALQALDESGRVLYSGTFSKTIFPGLRLGYLVVPNQLVGIFRSVKSLLDTACPTFTQLALADFMRDGHFERHLRRSKARNAGRRAVLLEAIHRYFGDRVEVSGAEGGLHILLWLREASFSRTAELVGRAEQAGVGVYPVGPFYLRPPMHAGLLLGYTSLTEKEIAHGIRRLASAIA